MATYGFLRTSATDALALMFSAYDQDRPYVVFDVRDPHSFGHGHLPGAISLDEHGAGAWIANAPRTQPVFIYCRFGLSSQTFAKRFADAGFSEVHSIEGGFGALVEALKQARAEAFAATPPEDAAPAASAA